MTSKVLVTQDGGNFHYTMPDGSEGVFATIKVKDSDLAGAQEARRVFLVLMAEEFRGCEVVFE